MSTILTRGQMDEVVAGLRPLAALKTVTFDGGISSGKLSTKAALTTTLTGANNDMVFTAKTAGLAGNNITIEYRNPNSLVARAIQVHVKDSYNIIVDLGVASATAASKVLTSDNTNVTDGDTVTVGTVAYRFKNTMAAINDVKIGTDADTTMGNLIKAINGTGTDNVEYFAGTVANPDVSAGALAAHAFTATARVANAAGNLIAIAENSTHLSWAGGATALSGGLDAGQIISTAAQVKTAFDANTEAAALVDSVVNSGADDGSGVVTAMAATALSGGSDGTIPLFTVQGTCLVSLRGYCETTLAGTNATLVHGKTGTTNDLIPILTCTNIVAGAGIDKSAAVVARGTALDKVPLKTYFNGQTIFATTATAATTAGKIHYVCDFIPLTENAGVLAS